MTLAQPSLHRSSLHFVTCNHALDDSSLQLCFFLQFVNQNLYASITLSKMTPVLPWDIVHMIPSYLPQADLFNFILASRAFKQAAHARLYDHVELSFSVEKDEPPRALMVLLKRIVETPCVASRIKSLCLIQETEKRTRAPQRQENDQSADRAPHGSGRDLRLTATEKMELQKKLPPNRETGSNRLDCVADDYWDDKIDRCDHVALATVLLSCTTGLQTLCDRACLFNPAGSYALAEDWICRQLEYDAAGNTVLRSSRLKLRDVSIHLDQYQFDLVFPIIYSSASRLSRVALTQLRSADASPPLLRNGGYSPAPDLTRLSIEVSEIDYGVLATMLAHSPNLEDLSYASRWDWLHHEQMGPGVEGPTVFDIDHFARLVAPYSSRLKRLELAVDEPERAAERDLTVPSVLSGSLGGLDRFERLEYLCVSPHALWGAGWRTSQRDRPAERRTDVAPLEPSKLPRALKVLRLRVFECMERGKDSDALFQLLEAFLESWKLHLPSLEALELTQDRPREWGRPTLQRALDVCSDADLQGRWIDGAGAIVDVRTVPEDDDADLAY
jgi:hypothetical protein